MVLDMTLLLHLECQGRRMAKPEAQTWHIGLSAEKDTDWITPVRYRLLHQRPQDKTSHDEGLRIVSSTELDLNTVHYSSLFPPTLTTVALRQ